MEACALEFYILAIEPKASVGIELEGADAKRSGVVIYYTAINLNGGVHGIEVWVVDVPQCRLWNNHVTRHVNACTRSNDCSIVAVDNLLARIIYNGVRKGDCLLSVTFVGYGDHGVRCGLGVANLGSGDICACILDKYL